MNPILVSGPAVEPVGLDEMRGFLRLDDAAEDDLMAALIVAARRHVEAAVGRALIAQTWRLVLDGWPRERRVTVPLSPLIAVEAVRVADAGGVPVMVPPALYQVDAASDPPRVLLSAAAPAPATGVRGIEIDCRIGYGGAAEDVPAPLRHAIRILVARWFENRGDAVDGAPPPHVLALITPFRRPRL